MLHNQKMMFNCLMSVYLSKIQKVLTEELWQIFINGFPRDLECPGKPEIIKLTDVQWTEIDYLSKHFP